MHARTGEQQARAATAYRPRRVSGIGRAPGTRAGAAVSRMRSNAAGRAHTVIAVSSSLAALVLGLRRERLWGAMLAVQMAPGQTGRSPFTVTCSQRDGAGRRSPGR
jgi:hypothetical protein